MARRRRARRRNPIGGSLGGIVLANPIDSGLSGELFMLALGLTFGVAGTLVYQKYIATPATA